MGTRQLARVGIGAEDISGTVVGPVDLGNLTGRRISNQMQQGDSTVFYRGEKKDVRPQYAENKVCVRREGSMAGYNVRSGY